MKVNLSPLVDRSKPEVCNRNFCILGALLLLSSAMAAIGQAPPRSPLEPPEVTLDAPSVTVPPESFFHMISNRLARPNQGRRANRPAATISESPEALAAELTLYRSFYRKHIDIRRISAAAHGEVSDLALQRTYEIVTHMLAGRPDILNAMVSNQVYLIVIGKHQVYTDMPEYRHHPNPQFQNERVRGTGGNPTSFGEENLLSLPLDRYDDESIAVHEFCHTIDSTLRRLEPDWSERRNAAYENAVNKRLYEGTYAASNAGEYWAEIAQAYFDCNRVRNWNHGPIGTREELRAHDATGYELCHSVFKLSPQSDWRYTWLQKLPMVSSPPKTAAFSDIDPWYTKFTWAREFTVLGRGATDEALLQANEVIRRVFAYRHDILKALIQDGAKLVVLSADERLSDLPEVQKLTRKAETDLNSRYLTYDPELKLLVVPQEDVLSSAPSAAPSTSQLIRVFADALYKVAGQRPVIPDFQGNQQYELRVKRLDEAFDRSVKVLLAEAKAANRWRGSDARTDHFAYWSAGVLAYFDALSPEGAGFAVPVTTREALKEYDPGLFELVTQTMAYENKVDWRYRSPVLEPRQVAQPTAAATATEGLRGSERRRESRGGRIYRAQVTPRWSESNTRFWYRNDLVGGGREFILVDAERGTRTRAFDHVTIARQIGGDTEAAQLPVESLEFTDDPEVLLLIGRTNRWRLHLTSGKLEAIATREKDSDIGGIPAEERPRPSTRTGPETEITFENRLPREARLFWLDDQGRRQAYGTIEPGGRKVQHTYSGHVWLVASESGQTLAVFEATERPGVAVIDGRRPQPRQSSSRGRRERRDTSGRSPDGKWTAVAKEHNVFLRSENGEEIQLSTDGSAENGYGTLAWSPDSQTLVAWRTEPGERKEVHLVRSSPENGGRAQLVSRPYVLPGDKFRKYELNLFRISSRQQIKPEVDRFEHEWLSPRLHWNRNGDRVSYQQVDRGHQRLRVIEVDANSGAIRNIIDERSETFIWTAHTENLRLELVNWLEQTDEIILVSERDGWRHLYLVDAKEGAVKTQITKGQWVIRGIERIDEGARQIWFSAGGRNPDQDPYFLHHYRVNFDGTELVALTSGNGNHRIEFSPDRKHLIDTWSRVDLPPVTELRRSSDGSVVCRLEEADISELLADGWKAPEPFVAKGRDGKTDIYGLIHWPRNIQSNKKYPVIESVYAGPQGSFVPKSFSVADRFKSLTDLGFVVVQIDGMGTANRSKAFHDVCYKNLKDGGFPDRILWIKAAAAKHPELDLSRVGVYGNSAGGQNAAAAVLFHPEFYKAAVASCGCHDNRMDKASWNEQWMGYMPADQLWREELGNWYAASSNISNAHRLRGKLFLIVGEMDTNVPPESTMRFVDALIRAGKDFELLVIPNGGHGMGGAYGERRMRDFFARHFLNGAGDQTRLSEAH